MAQKEPRDAESGSPPSASDAVAAQQRQRSPSSSRPTRPNPVSGPMASHAALAAGATPYEAWEPVSSSSPIAAGSRPYESFPEELPSDELTAVFAPSPELLARSGQKPTLGSAWEEPTQVVHVGDVLGAALLDAAPTQPPPAPEESSQAPSLAQLDFERQRVALVTPLPAVQSGRRWLWWAIAALLGGAAVAALAEYSLHPPRGSSSPGAGIADEPR